MILRTLFLLPVLLATLPCAAVEAEAVSFMNGEITLAGTLLLPEGDGPFPAAVFVHGSGPHTREGALEWGPLFAEAGYALLAFDKRGTGASEGSWVSSSLEDLASDVTAAVAFLRASADIDGNRVGLWGVSQAGWVAPVAAEQDGRIAFMIIVSGGGATPLSSELYSYDRLLEREGASAEQLAAVHGLLGRYWYYLGTGRGRDEALAAIAAAKDKPWYPLVDLERIMPSTEAGRRSWAWVANWDPLLAISRIRCPVLLIFGDADEQQPTAVAVRRWRAGLALAGNADYRIEVFPGANHGLRRADAGGGHHGRAPYVEGYRELVRDWLAGLHDR